MRLAFTVLLVAGLLPATTPPYRILNTSDGLIRNLVNRIRSGRHGFLWFCTPDGLSIYDGAHFTNITSHEGLPSRSVRDVIETRDGRHWLATDAGLIRFEPNPSATRPMFVRQPLNPEPAHGVDLFFEDSSGVLWIATEQGLYRLESNAPPDYISATHDIAVLTMAEDSAHRLWLGSYGGIFVLSSRNVIAHLGQQDGIGEVRSILTDSKGRIWSSGAHLLQLDFSGAAPRILRAAPDQHDLRLSDLFEDSRGDIWAGGFGLHRIAINPSGALSLLSVTASIPGGDLSTTGIAEDTGGNIWTGLSDLGALRLSREPLEQFSSRDGLENLHIASIFLSRAGEVFILTDTPRILYRWAGARMQPIHFRLPKPANDFSWGWGSGATALQDSVGSWWFVSGEGLLQYPPSRNGESIASTIPRIHTTAGGLPSDIVLRVFEDHSGKIWAGTAAGVASWDRAAARWRKFLADSPDPVVRGLAPVHAIAEDRNGAIWVGFATPSMLRIRAEHAEPVPTPQPRGFVNAILPDRTGRLWLAMSSAGIGLITDSAAVHPSIISITPENGLPSLQTFALAETTFGEIFVSGGRAVSRLTVSPDRAHISATPVLDGEHHILAADRDGGLWIGDLYSLLRYRLSPPSAEALRAPAFRHVEIAGEPYPISLLGETRLNDLQLNSRQSHLSLEFRASYFTPGSPLRYQYRLTGAGERWSTPSESNSVQYASLAPGSYRFEVRAVGKGGVSPPSILSFHIAPPFWATTWFRTAVAVLLAAVTFGLHLYRVHHFVMLERVRVRLASDLHDDLGAGLAEIAVLSEVAQKEADARITNRLVGQRARSLRASLSDVVWSIDPRFDRLADLVGRMRETAFNILSSESNHIEFSAPPEDQLDKIEVSPEVRRHVLLFFKEAVTNVAKHAGARSVRCEVSLAPGQIRVRVLDHGRGFDPAIPSSGFGLRNLAERARQIGGRFVLSTSPGAGVDIQLHAPLKAAVRITRRIFT